MLVKHLDWRTGGEVIDAFKHRRYEILTTEVPDDKVTPAGKVGDSHNRYYNPIWLGYFPPDAELVKVHGFYGDPWLRDWPNVGPSSAPYSMMAVKVANGPVKGEQPGMLGVPGRVHTQKRPYTPGQMEFKSYGKYKEAKEQTTVPEEMKLLPNAKQNLYFWTVEQLREECIRQGLLDPTKRLHKKALIDLLEPGLGLRPPYARKIGQVWDPEKHIWIDG